MSLHPVGHPNRLSRRIDRDSGHNSVKIWFAGQLGKTFAGGIKGRTSAEGGRSNGSVVNNRAQLDHVHLFFHLQVDPIANTQLMPPFDGHGFAMRPTAVIQGNQADFLLPVIIAGD